MSISIRSFRICDYAEVLALWKASPGVCVNEMDTRGNIAAYLRRNRGMSFVARDGDGRIVGAVLCGHDGRRGYLHHLAVAKDYRKRGIGGQLVEACFAQLIKCGIVKCNIFVFADNLTGQAFWKKSGWNGRSDLLVMQKPTAVLRGADRKNAVKRAVTRAVARPKTQAK
ncbi:MAG TPA: GNAT family N-acetyltransferase [Planctomycetota bacterium]|jgi:putative acetyltransferase